MRILIALPSRFGPRLQSQIPRHKVSIPSSAYLLSRKYSTQKMANAEELVATAKQLAALTAVKSHYPTVPPKYIGIGSGSTIVHVVAAIANLDPSLTQFTKFIPTGFQSKQLLLTHNLTVLDIDLLPIGEQLEVAFDGADEVDQDRNCIKGGGACLFQEKIVAVQAKKLIVVADFRKISRTLCTPTTWASGIPIEVVPSSYPYVTKVLLSMGAQNVSLRPGGKAKAGPCVTDNGNFLLDALFPSLSEGEAVVETLAEGIKGIVGVVEHGLFYGGPKGWKGRPEMAYFGMADGGVNVLGQEGWIKSEGI